METLLSKNRNKLQNYVNYWPFVKTPLLIIETNRLNSPVFNSQYISCIFSVYCGVIRAGYGPNELRRLHNTYMRHMIYVYLDAGYDYTTNRTIINIYSSSLFKKSVVKIRSWKNANERQVGLLGLGCFVVCNGMMWMERV